MNIEIKRIKMCQDSLTHTSKTKDAQKRLIETKLPKYAQIEGVRNQAEIHSICLPHVKVHKIIEFSINTIDWMSFLLTYYASKSGKEWKKV